MALTAEQYSLIIESLRSDAVCGQSQEQRLAPRVGVRVKSTIAYRDSSGNKYAMSVWIRDISTAGIGMLSEEPLSVGSFFIIVFRGRSTDVSVLYRVKRSQELSRSEYLIGACVDRYLGDTPPESTSGRGTPAAIAR